MNDIATEYASALFLLASEENKTEEYHAALETVSQVLEENEEYLSLLASPAIPLVQRLKLIDDALSSEILQEVLSYLKLLCEKGRISYFLSSAKEYHRLYEKAKRRLRVKVTSAVELTEEEKKKLTEKLEQARNCSIDAEYFVDEALLGGVIVETDSKIWDGSVRSRLQKVKEVINS